MQFVSFHQELAVSNLLFQKLFQNIQIEHVDSKGVSTWYKVPCVNSQRSRILKQLQAQDRKANIKLPMIAYSRSGYTRAGDRLNNLHNEVKYEITSKNRNQNILTPVPIDISYDLTVFAKYQSDIDKIASNFMVFFNNDIYVSQDHPVFHGIRLHNQVVMQDSVSEEHPDEFDGSQDDVVTSTFQFTFKTYLFGGVTQYRKRRLSYIQEEISTWYNEETSSYESAYVSTDVSTDIDVYDGIPTIKYLSVGFYDVPNRYDIDEYMTSVDNNCFAPHDHWTPSSYISSESYVPVYGRKIDGEGQEYTVLSSLSGVNDYYEQFDSYCGHGPYVDRMAWYIDGSSTAEFPQNVKWRSCQ